MILPSEEAERFYRIWWALLRYTNAQRDFFPDLPISPEAGSLPPPKALKIRQALWEDDALREGFIAENPTALPPEDLEIVASWQHRVSGNFFVLRHLKKYTVFLDRGTPARVYGVLGLISPIEDVIGPYLPLYVNAVLLLFEDKIIYDSLLNPYNISFGRGIRESLNTAYRDAQEREGIITSLLPRKEPSTAEEAQETLRDRNARIIKAFEKALFKSGLSPKMVQQHVSNIGTFVNDFLLGQAPPRPLLEVEAEDMEAYLGSGVLNAKEVKAAVTSFKRLARFLCDSGRMEPGIVREIQDALKLHRRRIQ